MEKDRPAPGAGPLGLAIFLVSLAVLFAASLVGYWAVRLNNPAWSAGLPPLPGSLWLSTGVLVLSSLTIHAAVVAVKANNQDALKGALAFTLALGAVFLGIQAYAWFELMGLDVTGRSNLYGFTFYLLTALHAVHVVGGLIPLGITTARAGGGRYTPQAYDGVLMCAMYWHFLDVVWVVLFLNMVVF